VSDEEGRSDTVQFLEKLGESIVTAPAGCLCGARRAWPGAAEPPGHRGPVRACLGAYPAPAFPSGQFALPRLP
jgi:hypothetical protein